MRADDFGMVECPTCAGCGVVEERDYDEAVSAMRLAESDPAVVLREQLVEVAQLRKDLDLALDLLSSELNQEPCRVVEVGSVEVATVRVWPDGTRQKLPPGACLTHPYESEQPCPIGEGQRLLATYRGIRRG